MSTERKLLSLYAIVAILLLGTGCAIYLSHVGIAILLIVPALILRWCLNPVPEAYRKLSKSTVGKVLNALTLVAVLGLLVMVLTSGSRWAAYLLIYGLLVPVAIVYSVILVKEELRAAEFADSNKIEMMRGQ
jgi:hypothetical protein